MNMIEYFNSPVCTRLVLALAHFLWQGLGIALFVTVASSVFGRNSSRVRYGICTIGLFAMVLSLVITYALIDVPIGQAAAKSQPMPERVSIEAQPPAVVPLIPSREPSEALEPALVEPISEARTDPKPVDSKASQFPLNWRRCVPYVVSLYFAGVLVMIGRLLIGLQGGQRLRRFSIPADDETILGALSRQARVIGLAFTPAVAFCKRVVVPTVVGILKPTILLPVSFAANLSLQQIEMLLAHELAHIRRYDPLVNIIQRVIEAVLFFHPAVWFVSGKIRVERENCCDDLVLEAGGKAAEYASSLVEIAQRGLLTASKRRLTAEGISSTGKPSRLGDRIRRMIGVPRCPQVRLTRPGTIGTLLVLAVAISTMVALSSKADVTKKADVDADASDSAFKATLPNGVTVELVGVCDHPIEGRQWWRPDGSPMEPLFDRVSYQPDKVFNNYIFSVKLRGMPSSELGPVHWRATGADHIRTTTAYLDDKRIYHNNILTAAVMFPVNSGSTDLQVGLATGKWQTIASGSHRGYYENGDNSILVGPPHLHSSPGGEILSIGVTYNINSKERDFRVLAVDKGGNIHYSAENGTGHSNNLSHRDAVFPKLNRKQLKEFRFQTRPYEWVEFKSVSLKPNHKTDEQAELEQPTNMVKSDWGESVGGVQVRVRPEQVQGRPGEPVVLYLDIRNVGREARGFLPEISRVGVAKGPALCRSEVLAGATGSAEVPAESYWYDKLPSPASVRSGKLIGPGRTIEGIKIVLDESWGRYEVDPMTVGGMPPRIKLKIDGNCKVQLALPIMLADKEGEPDYDSKVYVYSRPVQVDVAHKSPWAEAVWGVPVNGLQAAVEFIPEKESYSVGEVIGIRFHIQNVSDRPIQLASSDWRQEDGLVVKDANGEEVSTGSVWYSGMPTMVRVILLPGQHITLESPSLGIGAVFERQEHRFTNLIGYGIECRHGRYFLQFELDFPDVTSTGVPVEDDWQGELQTGRRKLVITPAPEVLLGRALRKFCAEQPKDNKILVCLLQMQEVESQEFVKALAKRAQLLEKHKTAVLLVNTSDVDDNAFKMWLDRNPVPYAVVTIADPAGDIGLLYDVKNVPWLWLLDEGSRLHSTGFGLDELRNRLTSSARSMSLNPREMLDAFLAAAYRGEEGKDEEARKFVHPRSSAGTDVDDFYKRPDGQKMEIVDVYADRWSALAVTSAIQTDKCECIRILKLRKELGAWRITQIGCANNPEQVQQKMSDFLKKHPRARAAAVKD
jgi:hypothetical protein